MNPQLDRFVSERTYFIVTFADKDLMVPIVQTLVYQKKGTRANGTVYYLFKELHADRKASQFLVDEEHADDLVLDQAGLIQKLKDCFAGKLLTIRPEKT